MFPIFAQNQLTFSKWKQDKHITLNKYQAYWNDKTITQKHTPSQTYILGEQVATITIPKMNIYELPVYYGSNALNNNWQITTPGHLGNWSIFGEDGVTCVGAHNYQLFKNLKLLENGDKLIIETKDDIYVYIVDNTNIYNHETDDWDQVATTHKRNHALNLMTCYPFDAIKTKDMYIVYTTMQRGTIYK